MRNRNVNDKEQHDYKSKETDKTNHSKIVMGAQEVLKRLVERERVREID